MKKRIFDRIVVTLFIIFGAVPLVISFIIAVRSQNLGEAFLWTYYCRTTVVQWLILLYVEDYLCTITRNYITTTSICGEDLANYFEMEMKFFKVILLQK